MTLTGKLRVVGTTLAQASERIYHYRKPTSVKAPYGVWQEDSEDTSFNASNKKAEQKLHGTIDWYSLTEYDPVTDAIQTNLDYQSRVSYRLNSVQYEDATNLIHTEWEWWIS